MKKIIFLALAFTLILASNEVNRQKSF